MKVDGARNIYPNVCLFVASYSTIKIVKRAIVHRALIHALVSCLRATVELTANAVVRIDYSCRLTGYIRGPV